MEDEYEIICPICSQSFLSKDEEDMFCPECWEKIMLDFFESIKGEMFDI